MDLLRFACFVTVQSWMIANCIELVRLPPSIVKGPLISILFRNEETIQLSCSASGVPPPTYEWIKNGKTLEMNLPNILRVSDGGIQLSTTSSLDEGLYQCKASNQWGTAYSNVSVVRRTFLDRLGSANVLDKVATEGDPMRIDFEQMRSYPKSQNRWQSADNIGTSDSTSKDLVRSKRMQWDEHGNLFFSYVLPEDQLGTRIYKGVSYNPRVDISVGGSYTRLTVDKVPGGIIKPFGPRIYFSSGAPTIGLEGENITLRCFFAGYPGPDVQWAVPRKVPPVRVTLDNFNTELKIFDLKQSHEGEYTCTGTNSNGTVPHKISLKVQAVPVFSNSSLSPHNVNATEGDNVTFKCKPYAKPEANVTWMINGKLLDVAHRPSRISVSRDGHSLTIRSVCRDCSDRPESASNSDLMVIQCNASNEHGYAFAAGYLNVLKKTTVTLTTNREVVIDKDSQHPVAVFQCLPFSDPSTPVTLTWYRMVDNHMHVMHSRPSVVVVGNDTLTINAANDTSEWMKHEGQYKCVANNRYSKAEEIVRIQVNEQVILAHTATSILDLWWIFLLITCLLLILILILICYICIFCNRGDKYDVDGKERKNGNDPVKELVASGFHDYQRREIEPFKGSQNLLGSSARLFGDDSSEVGDHGGKFLENGSYRSMSYTDTSDRKKGRSEYI